MHMARPRIVGETKRAIEEREPPQAAILRPHDWLTEDSLSAFEESLSSGMPFGLYLSDLAEHKIRSHAMKDAPRRLEVMGFLLGDVRSWKGFVYTVVRDVGTTGLRSSSSKVKFDPDGLPSLFHQLDVSGFDYVLVGWYHSHPGHTCFLSRTDLLTQRSMFNEPYHVALVIDPVNRDLKTFRLAGDGYAEMPFALFRDEPVEAKRRPRRRKLKVTPAT
jgi:proteasome lid subunit RPN8/RPN11